MFIGWIILVMIRSVPTLNEVNKQINTNNEWPNENKKAYLKVGTPRYLTSMMESWFSDISRLKVELKVALYLSMILQVQKLGKE